VQLTKSDLEVYLGSFILEGNGPFDVLKWWNQNYIKFSILSKLVCDVLFISITIVAFELAFSAEGRVLDNY
jgi:hAT family C-terminal dimerisation region